MQLRTIVIGGAVLVAVFLVRRGDAPHAAPRRSTVTKRDARVHLPPVARATMRSAAARVDEPNDDFLEGIEVVSPTGYATPHVDVEELDANAEAVIADSLGSRGAIRGRTRDSRTGENLAGVAVTVSSPALEGAQTALSDDTGLYQIVGLPPGEYVVTFYYLDLTQEHAGVVVSAGDVTPEYAKLDTTTRQGITIDHDYIKNIPVPGRTFELVLAAAADSQGDPGDIGFGGTVDLNNRYEVDGIDTTGLTFSGGTSLENTYIIEGESPAVDEE